RNHQLAGHRGDTGIDLDPLQRPGLHVVDVEVARKCGCVVDPDERRTGISPEQHCSYGGGRRPYLHAGEAAYEVRNVRGIPALDLLTRYEAAAGRLVTTPVEVGGPTGVLRKSSCGPHHGVYRGAHARHRQRAALGGAALHDERHIVRSVPKATQPKSIPTRRDAE